MLGHLLSNKPRSTALKHILEAGRCLDPRVDQKDIDAGPENDLVRGCQMLVGLLQFSRKVLHMFVICARRA